MKFLLVLVALVFALGASADGPTSGADSVDHVDVIVGADPAVKETSNPNDGDDDGTNNPIICTKANGECFYRSLTTGWWAATSTNTTDATTWSAMQEGVLEEYTFEPITGTHNHATYDVAKCWILQTNSLSTNAVTLCTAQDRTNKAYPTDVLITGISAVTFATISGTEGCDIRLTTASGVTPIANAEIQLPPADGVTITPGTVTRVEVGTVLPAGTPFQIQSKDSQFSAATGAGNCNLTTDVQYISIHGLRR